MERDVETRLLIAGRWIEGNSGRQAVLNPYDSSVVAEAARADSSQVEQAVRAAEASGMESVSAADRHALLLGVSAEIERRSAELTRLLTLETGKPLRYSSIEVERAASTFSFAADEARRLHGETLELDAHPGGKGHFAFWHRFPLGVIAAISPFNFPLNLVAHKLAPALAAGNPVVLKPAGATPLSALALGRIIMDCGAPAGALNIVPGDGAVVGHALVRHPRIKMITFTGSLEVGRSIRDAAGMKRVTLELGANSAVIVEDEDRLEDAAARCVTGAFAFSGQVCISVQRILLKNSLAGRFLSLFVPRVEALRRGDPLDPATEIGPMISESEARRIEAWVDAAVDSGARVLTGGRRDGSYYEPTVIDNVVPGMDVLAREAFAPIVCIERYEDFGEALARVNDSVYGLQAGVYTESLDKAMQAFRRLEVGGVIINDIPTFRVDQMPYGGVKGSGTGREGPRFAVEEMTELKLCVMRV